MVGCFAIGLVTSARFSFLGVQGTVRHHRGGLDYALTFGTMTNYGTIGPTCPSQSTNNNARFTLVTTIGAGLLDLFFVGCFKGGFAYTGYT